MKEEILSINLLRFLAASMVLGLHEIGILLDRGYIYSSLEFLRPFSEYGHFGVDLFFIISGFVITLSSEGKSLGQFVSARFIRLYPVFWVCVSITTICILVTKSGDISLPQYFANLTMLPSYYGDYLNIDGPYWTLEIELKFYTIVAILLLCRQWIPIERLTIIISSSYALLYYILFYDPYSTFFINNWLGYFFHIYCQDYAQYFIAGALCYGIFRGGRSPQIYFALTVCYYVAVLQAFGIHKHTTDKPITVILIITVLFMLLLAISHKKITNASFTFLGTHYTKILITAGAITYPLYLLHSKIGLIVINTLSSYNTPGYVLIPVLILIIYALVSLVNKIDYFFHTIWKKSFVLQNLITTIKISRQKRVLRS